MADKRRESKHIDQSAESRIVTTVDGREVLLIGKQIEEFAGKKICAGGAGFGCYRKDPHPWAVRREYDDYSRTLRHIKLTAEQSEDFYYCRDCTRYQGCHLCVGDVASLICINCHDWANEISEKVHGRMVPRDKATDALNLVKMMATKAISPGDAQKLFSELFYREDQ